MLPSSKAGGRSESLGFDYFKGRRKLPSLSFTPVSKQETGKGSQICLSSSPSDTSAPQNPPHIIYWLEDDLVPADPSARQGRARGQGVGKIQVLHPSARSGVGCNPKTPKHRFACE